MRAQHSTHLQGLLAEQADMFKRSEVANVRTLPVSLLPESPIKGSPRRVLGSLASHREDAADSELEQLKRLTTVVSDTADFDLIHTYQPQDGTTNPSLVLAASKSGKYDDIVNQAIGRAQATTSDPAEMVEEAADWLAVLFGCKILGVISGRVSTEVDAKYSFDTEGSMAKAHKFIRMYQSMGIAKERVLIKMASTWEGIKAAEQLERVGIHCNLTLLFSFAQAVACAEAKVTLISPFVGRIMDWYKKQDPSANVSGPNDPGVVSVTRIFNYYKKYGYNTIVMGASFRNIDEIRELAGCDYLTISPKLLEELKHSYDQLKHRLRAADAGKRCTDPRIHLTEMDFRWMHNEDPMATAKLREGIANFNKDSRTLHLSLVESLQKRGVSIPRSLLPPQENSPMDDLCIAAVRCLAVDIVQKGKSGHPGMPLGMAPAAHIVWGEVMNHNPKDSKWFNRDRFVLSNGHGCALLYSMLHLSGYNLPLQDMQTFRQLDSLLPGHPERGWTDGVEVTTGPLGQGIANGVGLAMTQAHLAGRFNRPGFSVVDNYTYVFCGDGCLQEGVGMEAASLAGHLGLGRLIVVYDDNKITIDGPTSLSYTENVQAKFEALNWHTVVVEDANTNLHDIRSAISEARQVSDRPSLILANTTIGFGSHLEGTSKVHGAPLGPEGVAKLKTKFGRDPEKSFFVEQSVYDHYREAGERGAAAANTWQRMVKQYSEAYPQLGQEFNTCVSGNILPPGWKEALPVWATTDPPVATRKASETVIDALAKVIPTLFGGSADLTPSNLTRPSQAKDFQAATPDGRYIRFGVREHGMAAIANGIAAYGAMVPYVGTFFNFIGYALGAIRLSALSELGVIYVATHDSIGLGEDGPTHQPIELAAGLRAMPNLMMMRPADGNETSGAYMVAVERRTTPTVIALSRQNLPQLELSRPDLVALGAYVVLGPEYQNPDAIIVSTGSEVHICIEAAKQLRDLRVRVVSMPCWELFDQQSQAYRSSILCPGSPVMSVEVWATTGWEKYAHHTYGIDTFGASAPAPEAYKKFGFTPEAIARRTRQLVDYFKRPGVAKPAPRGPIILGD